MSDMVFFIRRTGPEQCSQNTACFVGAWLKYHHILCSSSDFSLIWVHKNASELSGNLDQFIHYEGILKKSLSIFRRKTRTKTPQNQHARTTQFSKDTKRNLKFSLLFAKPEYGLGKQRDQARTCGSHACLMWDSGLVTVQIWDNL